MKKFSIIGLIVVLILAGIILAKVEGNHSTDNLPELIEQVETDLDSLKVELEEAQSDTTEVITLE